MLSIPSKSVFIALTYTFIRIHKTTIGTTWQVKENLTKYKIEQTRKNYHPQIINVLILILLLISHETARVVILLLSYALLNLHPSPAPPKQERKVCFKSNFPAIATLRFPSIIDAHIKTSFPV